MEYYRDRKLDRRLRRADRGEYASFKIEQDVSDEEPLGETTMRTIHDLGPPYESEVDPLSELEILGQYSPADNRGCIRGKRN